jgi:hypothetical protein
MPDDRLNDAIERIDRALSRIEGLARIEGLGRGPATDGTLERRHLLLRDTTRAAITRIDALIAALPDEDDV